MSEYSIPQPWNEVSGANGASGANEASGANGTSKITGTQQSQQSQEIPGMIGQLGRLGGLWQLGRLGILGLVGAIAIMGCGDSASDVFVSDSQHGEEIGIPIAFSGNMEEEKSVTRAGLEDKGQHLFTVYGYKNTSYDDATDSYTEYQTVFPGYTVNWAANTSGSSTTNSDGWEYAGQELVGQDEQTVKYWDWSAKAYRFFGVTNPYNKLDVTEADGAIKLKFSIDLRDGIDDVPYYSHLWFSNNNFEDYPTRKYGDPVELEFLKPMCQVRIMFIYEDPANNRINTPLDEISFHRSDGVTIKQNGHVTITYPLTGTETTETFSDTNASGIDGFKRDFREDEPTTTEENEKDHFWYHVLPCIGQGSFTLDVLVDGDPKTAVVPAEFMDWKPGYNYTYIFKIHVDGSVSIDAVQSAFTGWTVTSKEYTVHNW
ncbi:MAG: hypothetical protein IKQ59_04925 [Prevotella sp.]|nr:hypothetical protein [Prevotella sp.]MBR6276934.1 hypothetical protein [Prevotella sp.]